MESTSLSHSSKLQKIYEHFGTSHLPFVSGSVELRYNCQFCSEKSGSPDTNYKFYVNSNTLNFFCFRCQARGSLKKSFKDLSPLSDVYANLLENIQELVVSSDTTEELLYLPKQSPINNPVAKAYLNKRGITDLMIDKFDLRVATYNDPEYQGRILIPDQVFNKHWCHMFTARAYFNDPIRYKNIKGIDKSRFIYNYQRVLNSQKSHVIIQEGPLKVISSDDSDCVGLYGKYPSDEQIRLLVALKKKIYYCVLDREAALQNEKLASRLSNQLPSDSSVYVITMPDERDATDLGFETFRDLVFETRVPFISSSLFKVINFFTRD